jgi:hypothetical protein
VPEKEWLGILQCHTSKRRRTSRVRTGASYDATKREAVLLRIVVSARGAGIRITTPRYEFTQGDLGGLDDNCSAIRCVS